MKRLFSIFAVALLSLAVVSCSKEDGMPETGGSTNTLTFTFEGLNYGPVSYAIATTPENAVTKLDIYMFEAATGAFLKKWNWEDGVANAEATITTVNLTQTLRLTGAESFGVTNKVLYFVANPDETTSFATPATEAAFKELLTDALTVNAGEAELLETPLLFTGKSAEVNPVSGTTSTVTMRRRVSRFDIVNEYTDLVVQKVLVSDAKINGYAFGNAVGTNASGILSSKHEEITGPIAAEYETVDNERVARSWFYLYPTKVNAGTGSTSIALLIKNGAAEPELVYVKTANFSVDANYRYKLVLSKNVGDNSITIDLVYADWDEGGSTEVERDDIGVTMSNLSWAGGDYDFTSNAGGTLTFTVTSASGTTPQFTFTRGNASDLSVDPAVANKTSVVTYAAKTVETYEVTIPEYSVQSDFMNIQMTLVNNANPSNNESFSFITTSLAITPAAFPDADFMWDVQRLFDANSDNYLTLAEVADVTEYVENSTGTVSYEGIKIFTELEKFSAYDNTGCTEFDFSGMTKLKHVDVSEGNPSAAVHVNVSGCKALETLYIYDGMVESVNLKGCVNLWKIQAYSAQLYDIDLSDCVALKHLEVDNTNITALNLSNNRLLEHLCIDLLNLTSLDLSKNSSLKILAMFQSPLTSIDLSANLLLEEFWATNSSLLSLDLSNNNALNMVWLENTSITGDIYVTNAVYTKATVTNINLFKKPDAATWAVKP